MRMLTPILLSTIGFSIPLVFGSESLNGTENSDPYLQTKKIIDLSRTLTSQAHKQTFANTLTSHYLTLKTAGAPPELLEQTRSAARDLWLHNIDKQKTLTLKIIEKNLESLNYPLDAIAAYKLALKQALSTPIKQDLERILIQLRSSLGDKKLP